MGDGEVEGSSGDVKEKNQTTVGKKRKRSYDKFQKIEGLVDKMKVQ